MAPSASSNCGRSPAHCPPANQVNQAAPQITSTQANPSPAPATLAAAQAPPTPPASPSSTAQAPLTPPNSPTFPARAGPLEAPSAQGVRHASQSSNRCTANATPFGLGFGADLPVQCRRGTAEAPSSYPPLQERFEPTPGGDAVVPAGFLHPLLLSHQPEVRAAQRLQAQAHFENVCAAHGVRFTSATWVGITGQVVVSWVGEGMLAPKDFATTTLTVRQQRKAMRLVRKRAAAAQGGPPMGPAFTPSKAARAIDAEEEYFNS